MAGKIAGTGRDAVPQQSPVRTCIGCRQRAAATGLLRVVAASVATGTSVVADPHRRMPGRGAWLHPDVQCVEQAVRRRAFARALRVGGDIDPTPVCEYVAQAGPGSASPRKCKSPEVQVASVTTSNAPQEMSS